MTAAARRYARTSPAFPALISVFASRVVPLNHHPNPAFGLLVLDQERWWHEDLEELGMRTQLYALPSIWRQRLLRLQLEEEDFCALRRYDFTPAGFVRKDAALAWLRRFIPALAERTGFHAIVTTNHMYAQNKLIAEACRGSRIPFIDLHKESMKDDGDMHALFRAKCAAYDLHLPFLGDRICVYNSMMRDLFVAMGIAPAHRIAVTGALRIDRFRRRLAERVPQRLDTVTLFSFRHMPPGAKSEEYVRQFSPDGNHGYARLFDAVHGTFATLAAANPRIRFVVKMKWHDTWAVYVRRAIERAGLRAHDIPNLSLVADEEHAQDLITRSLVVIGFNSTTIFEARLAGRPVVLPRFEELAGQHRDTLAFRSVLDEFTVVESATDLSETIQRSIDHPVPHHPVAPEIIERYFGYTDGGTLDRVLATIHDAVAEAAQRPLSVA